MRQPGPPVRDGVLIDGERNGKRLQQYGDRGRDREAATGCDPSDHRDADAREQRQRQRRHHGESCGRTNAIESRYELVEERI